MLVIKADGMHKFVYDNAVASTLFRTQIDNLPLGFHTHTRPASRVVLFDCNPMVVRIHKRPKTDARFIVIFLHRIQNGEFLFMS